MSNNEDLIKRLRTIINKLDYKPLYDTFDFLNNENMYYDDLPRVEDIPLFNKLNKISNVDKENQSIELNINNPKATTTNLSNIPEINKQTYTYKYNNNKNHSFRARRLNNITKINKGGYIYKKQLNDLYSGLNYTRLTSHIIKENYMIDINVDKLKKNINIINTLDKPVSNILIDIDALYDDELYEKININSVEKPIDNYIIHHDGLKVHMNDIDELSKPEEEIEITVPKLRYKKVPTLPEEPPEINIPEPKYLNPELIEPPIMFNEDIPDYNDELIKMGYSEDAVELLEGIPDLRECQNFINFYEDAVQNLTHKEKGLFELQTAKISEITFQLIMWNELDEFNEYFEEWLEEKGSEFQGAYLTEDGLKLNADSVQYLHLRDRIMVENRGQNASKMGSDFRASLQNGESAEKEVYDAFIDYLADKHNNEVIN